MNKILLEDVEYVSKLDFIPWENIKNKTFFVTGATGLIGYSFIAILLSLNDLKNLNIKIIALVRDLDKAKNRFSHFFDKFDSSLCFVLGSMEAFPCINASIDYIIHGASQTKSKAMVEYPVETIITSVNGTISTLNLAKEKHVKGYLYLSSMEVYGHPQKGHKVTENEIGTFIPTDLRNSYPLSKILCEELCCSYAKEYNIPAKIIRLSQTFGPDANSNDNRIFAYFGKCVEQKRDIILKTKGETERSYLYTRDAVSAILTVLLKGSDGGIYNASDEATYCSISDMAKRIAKSAGINVKYEIQDEETNGFPKTIYMDLDVSLLRSLGWYPGPFPKMVY